MTSRLHLDPATRRDATGEVRPADADTRLARSALRTLAYSSLFEFSLSADEVRRYLLHVRADLPAVERTLAALVAMGAVHAAAGRYALSSADLDPERHRRRAHACERAWRRARRWGAAIARLPFVRMVAVSGALAADNPDGGDLDFFVATASGRLWLCRAWIIQAVVRPARLGGDVVCPNYLLATDRLRLTERDPFAARELAQMVPLSGLDVYRRLRAENGWTHDLLPNAQDPPPRAAAREPPSRARFLTRALERSLKGPPGDALERWEMRRKIRELERRHGGRRPEVELDAGVCKGHYSGHGRRILEAWSDRLRSLGLEPAETESAPALLTSPGSAR